MNMDIREMTAEDRSTVLKWIRKRFCDAAAEPMNMILPRLGLAAADAVTDELLAAAFLYLDRTSPVAVCGWIYTNPRNSARTSARAVDTIVGALPQFARQHGAKFLLSCFGNRGINRMLDRRGFVTAEFAEHKILILEK